MRRILLVEDDKLTAMITQSRLEAMGYQVTVAYTGKEALEHYPEDFDLILLDLGLPDITGFEVARTIRSQESPDQRIPIVALTLMGAAEAEEACLQAGMDKYIPKPLDKAKLAAIASYFKENA